MASSINPFDAAVYICLLIARIFGLHAGLLRSLATIIGYVAAIAVVAATPPLAQIVSERFNLPGPRLDPIPDALPRRRHAAERNLALCGERGGRQRVIVPDRLAGAILGAVRVGLLAVVLVLVFDRIIPAGRDPLFLAGSRLRPILSVAGREGLRTLPPEVVDMIDRLKRERGL
jgi:membrane protein required for colicin V production